MLNLSSNRYTISLFLTLFYNILESILDFFQCFPGVFFDVVVLFFVFNQLKLVLYYKQMSTNGLQVFLTLKLRFMLYLLMLNFNTFFSLFVLIKFMFLKKSVLQSILYVRHIFMFFMKTIQNESISVLYQNVLLLCHVGINIVFSNYIEYI